MSKDKEKNKYKSSTVWLMFLFGIWIGIGMGGTVVALITANTLQDVDVAFERAIKLQKENNQLAIDVVVLKYQYNNTLDCAIQKGRNDDLSQYNKYIWDFYRQDAEKYDEVVDKWLEKRQEVLDLDFQLSMCLNGIHPLQQTN